MKSFQLINARIITYIFIHVSICTPIFLNAQDLKVKKADSLERALPKLTGKDKVKALQWLGVHFWYTRTDKAVVLLQKGICLARRDRATRSLPDLHVSLGVAFSIQSNYDSAKANYEKAIELAKSQQNLNIVATTYSNMAILYDQQGQYKEALDFLYKALDIKEQLGNLDGKANIYGSISNIFRNISDHKNALRYDSLAYKTAKETKNDELAVVILANMGRSLRMDGRIKEAKKVALQVLEHFKRKESSHRMANNYFNLGELLYIEFDELDSSYYYAQQSLAIFKTLHTPYEISNAYWLLSTVELEKGLLDRAEQHALKMYHLSDSLKHRTNLRWSVTNLMKVYLLKADFKKAKRYEVEFWALTDSLENENQSKAVIEIQTKYETKQKVKENELLKKDAQLNKAQLERKNYILLSSAMGVFLLVGLAISLTRSNRQKILINELLQSENQSLRVENLNAQLNQLKGQINPHFLFNSLNTLKVMLKEKDSKSGEFIDSLSEIYRNILQIDAADLVSLKEELSVAEAYIFLLKTRFEGNLLANFDLPEEILEKKIPPFSLQLLIENAVKHNIVSHARPLEITISLCHDNRLQIKNTFQPKRSGAKSTKIGLKNLQNRFTLLCRQEINIENDGQFFSVTVPLL